MSSWHGYFQLVLDLTDLDVARRESVNMPLANSTNSGIPHFRSRHSSPPLQSQSVILLRLADSLGSCRLFQDPLGNRDAAYSQHSLSRPDAGHLRRLARSFDQRTGNSEIISTTGS